MVAVIATQLVLALLVAAPFQASSLVRLTGRVVDAATNEPLPGVEIAFQRTPSAPGTIPLLAVSGRAGAFSIDIPSGDYGFVARRPGYVPSGTNETPTPVAVRGRTQTMPDIRIKQGGGTIAGRIVDTRGNPLPRLPVEAVRPAVLGDSILAPVGGTVHTDDLGQFRLSGLPVGKYYVAARLLPDPGDSAASAAFVSTYDPGVTD